MFDATSYRNSVLIPLAKDRGRLELLQQVIREVQLDTRAEAAARLDLAELFALSPSMNARDLAVHVKALEMTYNKQKSLTSSQLLRKLLELLKTVGGDITQPAFWSTLSAARTEAIRSQVDEFAQAVAEEHPLEVVTPEQVADAAARVGLGGMQMGDFMSALSKHGVSIWPDFEAPSIGLPSAIQKVMDYAEFRTIVDVVVRPLQPSDITVIDVLSYGAPPRSITPEDVARAKVLLQQQEAQVEEGARQAAQNALGALTSYGSVSELHAIVLAAAVNTTEGLLQRGLPRLTVRNELMRRGIHQIDASRLVAKLSATSHGPDLSDKVATWITTINPEGHSGTATSRPVTTPSIDFAGASYATRARLAAAMVADWRASAGCLATRAKRSEFIDEVSATFGSAGLSDLEAEWAASEPGVDRAVLDMILALDPAGTQPVVKGFRVSTDQLGFLARSALGGDRAAAEVVDCLYTQHCLISVAKLSEYAHLTLLDERWHGAVDRYKSIVNYAWTNGVSAEPDEPRARASLLGALTDAKFAQDLVHERDRSISEAQEALRLEWFQPFTQSDTSDPAAVLASGILAPPAARLVSAELARQAWEEQQSLAARARRIQSRLITTTLINGLVAWLWSFFMGKAVVLKQLAVAPLPTILCGLVALIGVVSLILLSTIPTRVMIKFTTGFSIVSIAAPILSGILVIVAAFAVEARG